MKPLLIFAGILAFMGGTLALNNDEFREAFFDSELYKNPFRPPVR